MPNDAPKPRKRASRAKPHALLQRARALYAGLDEALNDSLDALRGQGAAEDAREARARSDLIKAHLKALQALLDAEKTAERALDRQEPQPDTQDRPSSELDLDAAWVEFMDRIARLHAAR